MSTRERWLEPKTWLWILGVNAWGALLAVPAWHLRLWWRAILWAPLLFPLLVLAPSIQRLHPVGLLLAFPAALLLPAALVPRLTGVDVYVAATFLITVISLAAYLLGAAAAVRGGGIPPRSVSVRALGSREVPPRWRRRLRLVYLLAVLVAVLPVLLLSLLDGSPGPLLAYDEPLSALVVNAAAFSLCVASALAYPLRAVVFFFRGTEPVVGRPRQHPLKNFLFWGALFLGGAAFYFFYFSSGRTP